MVSRRALAAAAGIAIGVIALTGCASTELTAGGSASSTPTGSAIDSSFNDQDVMFAQTMIPHHAQAVEMAAVVLDKGDVDPRVTELAERIRDAQGPEIKLMNSWLDGWGKGAEPSGHAGHGMEGMMSVADMQALEGAGGDDAARLFLDQMIVHHMGALAMAETEIERGQNTDVTELAQKIIDDQRAEIEEMSSILNTL